MSLWRRRGRMSRRGFSAKIEHMLEARRQGNEGLLS
jgi:hypothetical protein